MTKAQTLIATLQENLESAAFLVSKGDARKEAHSTIVQSLILLSQLEESLCEPDMGTRAANHQAENNKQTQSLSFDVDRSNDSTFELDKVRRRVPKWFRNPHQNNSKIMLGFLELFEKKEEITTQNLRSECHDVSDFDGNFNQMKNFGEKNHGKIFNEINGVVTLWEPATDFILEQFDNFKKNSGLAGSYFKKESIMDIDATKARLISLVDEIKTENPSSPIEYHQQRISKKNMCIRGSVGTLWIEPFPEWYDIGLSGQSLTEQMTEYMEQLCGPKTGNKQSKPEPSHQPFWRVTDFKFVEAAARKYSSYKK